MTQDRLACIVLIFIMVFMAISVVLSHLYERRQWNGGVCRKNGLPWRLFDTDSHNGRGYKAGDETLWLSYPVDRHEVRLGVIIVEDERQL
jgi:hypothetical protein